MNSLAEDFIDDEYISNDFNSDLDILESLNESQKKAVLIFNRPLLILAGAGTGKTNTITKKIAYILKNKMCSPEEILALTFTNKAANEMKHRIVNIVNVNFYGNIGTFHSFCLKILRENTLEAKLESGFGIIDAQDQKDIVKDICKEMDICTKTYPIKNIIGFISKAKEDGGDNFKNLSIPQSFSLLPIGEILYKYNDRLQKIKCIDFDDILIKTIELFESSPKTLQYYQNKYKFIMIDEYQDTNKVQYRFVKYIAGNNQNLCVVGDDDQSIYSWRGSDVGNILKFTKDHKNAEVVKLEQNYRSSQNILEVANFVIKNNTKRLDKTLVSNKKDNLPVLIRQYLDERNEVAFIVNQINSLRSHGVNFSKIAILLRSSALSRYLEESFVKKNIPYKIIGGLKFYERKEVKDLLSYLKFINNPFDTISFKRAIQNPKRGLGDAGVLKITKYASLNELDIIKSLEILNDESQAEDDFFSGSSKKPISDLKLSSKILTMLNDFRASYLEWRILVQSGNYSLDYILQRVISDIDYNDFIKEESDDNKDLEQKQDNINEFLRLLSNYNSLGEFLEHITLTMENDNENELNNESVSIMTIHAAKGLEFEAVFMPFMEDGVFPNQRVLNEMKNESDLEEERRLCYVAITRTKKFLYMSFSKNRFFANASVPVTRSRFIDEICCHSSKSFELFEQEFSAIYAPKRFDLDNDEYGFVASKKAKNSGYTPNPKRALSLKPSLNKEISKDAKVIHKIFGQGDVKKVDGLFVEVLFENGDSKMIRKDFLEIVS
jgi:DNA helicase-2/ATP-dependent DNA helicase PcrA